MEMLTNTLVGCGLRFQSPRLVIHHVSVAAARLGTGSAMGRLMWWSGTTRRLRSDCSRDPAASALRHSQAALSPASQCGGRATGRGADKLPGRPRATLATRGVAGRGASNSARIAARKARGWRLTLCVCACNCHLPCGSYKMLRSVALALVAAASTEAFMAPAAWSSTPLSNRAVAKSGLASLQMKVWAVVVVCVWWASVLGGSSWWWA